MSFQDNDWFEAVAWWPAPDPNRDNYVMVRMHHTQTQVVKFQDIHAGSLEDAMVGAVALNPGWVADWAHHQWQSRGVFGTGSPRG